ncbi:GNAT family N-acetyltransferase [Streptomyces sp. NPDC020875]|uniref:GNAT family N-acetyltransferase n=1 Tax=Streptomyces sp. NPDC020875 TaxID=3154898 RepID=UPI0033E13D51
MSTAPPRTPGDLTFRDARPSDVPELAALIQAAYRGGDGVERGWTTEADIIGGQRIDADGIRDVMARDDSRLVTVTGAADDGIVSCFQLERRGDIAYFGLFAVRPGLQGGGVGRVVITEAERLAHREWGAVAMEMTVISLRNDLISWYERRGYRRTGELSPFPYGNERFGLPRRPDLVFERLVKPLG